MLEPGAEELYMSAYPSGVPVPLWPLVRSGVCGGRCWCWC